MSKTDILCLILLSTGYLGGCLSMVLSDGIPSLFREAVTFIRRRWQRFRKKHYDEVMQGLSKDVQIILKNYMKPIDYYGKKMYAVRNVKRFDSLMRSHQFEDLTDNDTYNRYYEFDKYIRECFKEDDGILVVINGKEYVAISPAFLIDPDSLVK